MKTIAILGATGETGKLFLTQALEKGYAIKVLVRKPDKIKLHSPLLEVVKGDVLDAGAVAKTITGASVVVSLFGHVKGSPKWLQTQGTAHIVEAMQQAGIKKFISLSGAGLPFREDKPAFQDYFIRGVMKLFVPHILEDAQKHAQVLEASALDWIIVRAPRLTKEPPRGNYRVGWVGINASGQIGRADLADFILRQVEEDEFIHKMPLVSY